MPFKFSHWLRAMLGWGKLVLRTSMVLIPFVVKNIFLQELITVIVDSGGIETVNGFQIGIFCRIADSYDGIGFYIGGKA